MFLIFTSFSSILRQVEHTRNLLISASKYSSIFNCDFNLICEIMNALIKEEPQEGYVLKQIPIPDPEGDEVLIQVERVINISSLI